MTDALIVLDPADKDRCQGIIDGAVCPNKAIPGTTFCEQCTDSLQLQSEERRSYFLVRAKDRNRVKEYKQGNEISRLKEGAILINILIEEAFNSRPETGVDLSIVEAITKLQKTNRDTFIEIQKLELAYREVWAKQEAERFVDRLIQVITEELKSSGWKDWELVQQRIAARILKELGEQSER